MPQKSDAAPRQQLLAFFANLEHELEKVEFFRPPDKRDTMQINLRNIFSRMQPTQQDIQTLHGVIMAIAEGRKGPARGGVLDSDEAGALRALLARAWCEGDGSGGPMRGLARLLRRNPTDAERALWEGITKDRRFAGLGFKRQTPVGTAHHGFRVVPAAARDRHRAGGGERRRAAKARAYKRGWLHERGYRVLELRRPTSSAMSRRCSTRSRRRSAGPL